MPSARSQWGPSGLGWCVKSCVGTILFIWVLSYLFIYFIFSLSTNKQIFMLDSCSRKCTTVGPVWRFNILHSVLTKRIHKYGCMYICMADTLRVIWMYDSEGHWKFLTNRNCTSQHHVLREIFRYFLVRSSDCSNIRPLRHRQKIQ